MGLLIRMIGAALRDRRTLTKPAQSSTRPLHELVNELCAASRPADAAAAIEQLLDAPSSMQEARALVDGIVRPVIEACARTGDAATACQLERLCYARLLRRFEDPAHYDAGFGLIDAPLHALGRRLAAGAAPSLQEQPDRLRLLFLVHNLGNDLAHVLLLADLLDAFLVNQPSQVADIGIVGQGRLSERLQNLQQRWGIPIWALDTEYLQHCYIEAVKLMEREGFDRLVVVAVPLGISYLTGVLEPKRLAWLSMKFELGTFEHLRLRCSFAAGQRTSRTVNGRTWHAAPPLFRNCEPPRPSGTPPRALARARRFSTVFYTINRGDKIRNRFFLDMVCAILDAMPDAAFVWTGREEEPDVVAVFRSRGLQKRQFFAGWVHPDDLLVGGDIFLDTPVLSGAVAARAVALGLPVITMVDSHSWINFFWHAYDNDQKAGACAELCGAIDDLATRGIALQCTDGDNYIRQAIALSTDHSLKAAYGQALALFAERYFLTAARNASEHIANLRS